MLNGAFSCDCGYIVGHGRTTQNHIHRISITHFLFFFFHHQKFIRSDVTIHHRHHHHHHHVSEVNTREYERGREAAASSASLSPVTTQRNATQRNSTQQQRRAVCVSSARARAVGWHTIVDAEGGRREGFPSHSRKPLIHDHTWKHRRSTIVTITDTKKPTAAAAAAASACARASRGCERDKEGKSTRCDGEGCRAIREWRGRG